MKFSRKEEKMSETSKSDEALLKVLMGCREWSAVGEAVYVWPTGARKQPACLSVSGLTAVTEVRPREVTKKIWHKGAPAKEIKVKGEGLVYAVVCTFAGHTFTLSSGKEIPGIPCNFASLMLLFNHAQDCAKEV